RGTARWRRPGARRGLERAETGRETPPFSAGDCIIRGQRKCIEGEGGGDDAQVNRGVAGDDDTSSGGAMFGDRTLEPGLIFVVERARGFVEDPHRRRRPAHTPEPHPPTPTP